MKNWLTALMLTFPLLFGVTLTGCDSNEGTMEEIGEEIDDEIDDHT